MPNLLEIIGQNSNNWSGIGLVQLASTANIDIAKAKNLLNDLHRAGKIRVREGLNDQLIFLK